MPTLQEQSDFILGPQVPIGTSWFDQTQVSMARKLGELCPTSPPTDPEALNSFLLHLHYYDLTLSQYIVHRRTGDPIFLAYARKCADSWWKYPAIDEGRMRNFEQSATSPKFAGLMGLMLRALDGRPELWDWIVEYEKHINNIWLKPRIAYPTLHYGVREGAFTLHFMVCLSQVLPDSYPLQAGGTATNGAQLRAQFLADAETIAVNYYGRLQFPDGSWRWNDPDETDVDGGTLQGITQPFQIGLLLMALIDLHQITTNTIVKETVKNMILKSCRHLYTSGTYRKDDPAPYDPAKRWRCFWYLYHGGTSVNPTKFERGGWSIAGRNADEISDARQGNGTVVAAFAYAYKISGDGFFLDAFNELWDASYGGSDSIRNLMASNGKGFNQNCRRSGSGLVWAGGVVEPLPLPAPLPTEPLPIEMPEPLPIIPAPLPAPGPVFTPSPDGTKGVEIFDSNNGHWTLGIDKQTFRNGVLMDRGAGVEYKWSGGIVYVRGTDERTWYKWTGTNWFEIGREEPGGTTQPTPAPTPIPEPPPPVVVPCSISAPESVSIPRNGSGTIAITLNGLTEPTEVVASNFDGQVAILPTHQTARGTSAVLQFGVRVKNKRQERLITFQSGCGSKTVKVNVV